MPLFDKKNEERVANSVRKALSEGDNGVSSEDKVVQSSKKKVGRPKLDPKLKKKSYQISMSEELMMEIEDYRNKNYPGLSRSAIITKLLSEIMILKR